MGRKPSISVVMPVYNCAAYLAEAIESILAQRFPDFEFVIVDDGSTDGSSDIIARYRDDRIVPIRMGHGGLVRALNEGVRRAGADLIARMDGDDVADDGRLQEQREFLKRHSDIAFLGSACSLIDSRGRNAGGRVYSCADAEIRRFMAVRSQFAHPTVMIRARCFREVGLYRDVVPEDYELFIRMLRRYRAANLSGELLKLRWHGESYTVRHRSESARFHKLCHRALLREHGSLTIPFEGECRGRDQVPRCEQYSLTGDLRRRHSEMLLEESACYLRYGYEWKGRSSLLEALRYGPPPGLWSRHLLRSFTGWGL